MGDFKNISFHTDRGAQGSVRWATMSTMQNADARPEWNTWSPETQELHRFQQIEPLKIMPQMIKKKSPSKWTIFHFSK